MKEINELQQEPKTPSILDQLKTLTDIYARNMQIFRNQQDDKERYW